MRCSQSPRHGEMLASSQEFIGKLSAIPQREVNSVWIDKFADKFPDVCDNCRSSIAKYIVQQVQSAVGNFKKIIFPQHSEFLHSLGTANGPCTGYQADQCPKV